MKKDLKKRIYSLLLTATMSAGLITVPSAEVKSEELLEPSTIEAILKEAGIDEAVIREVLSSISSVRSEAEGTEVTVKGVVTFKEKSGASFNYAIQDGTAGIALRGDTELEIGDEVTVKGTLGTFNGLLQIKFNEITKVSENNELPEPVVVTVKELIEQKGGEIYESQRVTLEKVEVTAISGNNITLKDDVNDTASINIYKAPSGVSLEVGDVIDVTGISSEHKSYQIRVVDAKDIVKHEKEEKPDTVGPVLKVISPKTSTYNTTPQIKVSYSDESEISEDSVKLYLDNTLITENVSVENGYITYDVNEALTLGNHTIKVEMEDVLGNVGIVESTFEIKEKVETGELSLYFGQLHSHTNNSDGLGSLDDAYDWAKNEANADYFAVTDHSNSFDNADIATMEDGTSSTKWLNGKDAAERYTDDSFVGMYAYEMTWSNGTGHINTFNTPGFENRNKAEYKAADALQTYYNKLKEFSDSISQLNHPGSTFGDFNDFAHYDEEIDSVITLIEVGNGEGPVRGSGYFPSYDYYTRALDKGWHVAPTNNQDNHKGKWVNANTTRTVILSDSLTEDGLYDALRNRRTYATEDENLRINYTLNGEVLGTILDETPSRANIKVEIEDPDNEPIGTVSVIVNGGKVVASKEVSSSKEVVEFDLPADYSYYYIRVDQADKDIAVTAPVWVGEVDKAGIAKTETSTTMPIMDEEFNITTSLFNNENTAMDVLSIEYSIDGKVIASSTEVGTVESLGTKEFSFPYTHDKAGNFNVDVKMIANVKGVEKVFTDVLKLKVAHPDLVSRVVVDGTHFNDYVSGYYANNMGNFTAIANGEYVDVNVVTDEITDELLDNTELLVISAPAKKSGTANDVTYEPMAFSDEFIATVKRFVDNGGNLMICGMADYQDGKDEYASSTQLNKLLEGIGATSRINNDQVVDDENKLSQRFRLAFTNFNMDSEYLDGVVEGQVYSFYSGCSVALDPAAVESGKATWLVKGHDTTYSEDTNSNTLGTSVPKGEVVALGLEELSGGGKMFIGGTVYISDFEVKATLDNANDLQYANYNIVMNALNSVKKDIKVTPIEEVKNANQGDIFCVEGIATSSTKEGNAFFDTIYIQDETAGINIFPVSGIDIELGQKVRVIGSLDQYEGEIQLRQMEIEVIDDSINLVDPKLVSTKDAMNFENRGSLLQVVGEITRVDIVNGTVQNIYVMDESGEEARLFINGYVWYSDENSTKLEEIAVVGNIISGIGLGSYDPEGARLRVRDRSEIKLVKLADNNNTETPDNNVSGGAGDNNNNTSNKEDIEINNGNASNNNSNNVNMPMTGGTNSLTVVVVAVVISALGAVLFLKEKKHS